MRRDSENRHGSSGRVLSLRFGLKIGSKGTPIDMVGQFAARLLILHPHVAKIEPGTVIRPVSAHDHRQLAVVPARREDLVAPLYGVSGNGGPDNSSTQWQTTRACADQ